MKVTMVWCTLSALAALLMCLSPSPAGELRQSLGKGDAFRFTVDAGKVVRPVDRRVMGISFFCMYDYLPIYDRSTGQWILNEHAVKAIQDLHTPFSRIFWLDQSGTGQFAWDLKGSIDRVAEMCRRFGIKHEDFVMEVEQQQQSESTSPEKWAEAVRYSKSKGYGFRLWEVCNEPYNGRWTADQYVEHVKAVYKAVKAVDPDAQIGVAAGLTPFNVFGATQTDDPIIRDLAGYYDFVSPHYYCHIRGVDQVPFEHITFDGNQWIIDAYVRPTRTLLDKYNPDRKIPILDTEWGMHGYNSNTGGDRELRRADYANRNSNIAGALHRAIRFMYYFNEGLVEGASQWNMLAPKDRPGWAIVAIDDDRLFVLYYLNYYFGRYVGDQVVSVSGTCPYYEKSGVPFGYRAEPRDISMPKAPVLATKSEDGQHLYLVVANGTENESLPCRVDLEGFRVGAAEGKRLTQADIDAPALVEKESDVVGSLPVKIADGGKTLTFEAAAHSISFISIAAAK